MGATRLSADNTAHNLERYTVLGMIGRGGMGVICRAYDPVNDQNVALKIIPVDCREGNIDKIDVVSKLRHPHILPILDYGRHKQAFYMAMPLVNGGTLGNRLDKGEIFTISEVLAFACQISAALDYIHMRGIVHMDISPHNIMFLDDNHVALTDFGIASISGLLDHSQKPAKIVGTVPYISPEQISNAVVDGRSDIYSLAAVLYQCLLGQTPFTVEAILSVLDLQTTKPIRPRSINPDFPEALEKVLLKALSKKPEDRFSSGRELYRALERSLEGLTVPQLSQKLLTPDQVTELRLKHATPAPITRDLSQNATTEVIIAEKPALLPEPASA